MILETAPDAPVITDRRDHIVFINPQAGLLWAEGGVGLAGVKDFGQELAKAAR